MRALLATTAVALLAVGPMAASAQDAGFVQSEAEGDLYGSDLIGMSLYAPETEVPEGEAITSDMRAEWEDVGEVSDILMSSDGQVKGVLVDIGGFLGLGEHTVAMDMSQLNLLSDEEGDHFATVTAPREALEAAPEFERADVMALDAEPEGGETAVVPVETTEPAAEATEAEPMDAAGSGSVETTEETAATGEAAVPPAVELPGYAPLAREELTAERLQGATVYDQNDETVGTISELVIDPEGRVTEAVLDVGGFLGIGAHSVALSFDELQVINRAEDGDIRVYTNATKESLEALPEWEG
jgi:sporulation protein YlmC with PRC-barrel domain